jgi:hypothetical protein
MRTREAREGELGKGADSSRMRKVVLSAQNAVLESRRRKIRYDTSLCVLYSMYCTHGRFAIKVVYIRFVLS